SVDGRDHAVLWEQGTVVDLERTLPLHSEWVLTTAQGINTAGWIVGAGTIHGQTHAFLLTPGTDTRSTTTTTSSSTTTTVPAPSCDQLRERERAACPLKELLAMLASAPRDALPSRRAQLRLQRLAGSALTQVTALRHNGRPRRPVRARRQVSLLLSALREA